MTFEGFYVSVYSFQDKYLPREEGDQMVEDFLFGWDNPEIGFPLAYENMAKWKTLLETGVDTLIIKNWEKSKSAFIMDFASGEPEG